MQDLKLTAEIIFKALYKARLMGLKIYVKENEYKSLCEVYADVLHANIGLFDKPINHDLLNLSLDFVLASTERREFPSVNEIKDIYNQHYIAFEEQNKQELAEQSRLNACKELELMFNVEHLADTAFKQALHDIGISEQRYVIFIKPLFEKRRKLYNHEKESFTKWWDNALYEQIVAIYKYHNKDFLHCEDLIDTALKAKGACNE